MYVDVNIIMQGTDFENIYHLPWISFMAEQTTKS